MTNALEVGPDGRLHLVVSNTHALADKARYYGASHIYSDDSGKTWRQFGDSAPLPEPIVVCRLKRIEGDALSSDRIEPNVPPWHQRPMSLNSYIHQILASNPAIDQAGTPWVIVHNIMKGDAQLYRAVDGSWRGTPFGQAVRDAFPGFHISCASQLALRADGTLEAVLMVLPEGHRAYGDPGTELARIVIGSDGRIRSAERVRSPDPTLAHWLPSIERRCWSAPSPRPALLFTRGLNASVDANKNRNVLDTEVWLHVP